MGERPNNDHFWRIVCGEVEAEQESFRYGVVTTGVYCRPACPSRRPRRENVRFFASSVLAEMAGYRPCKRCSPAQTGRGPRKAVIDAVRQIEAADEMPLLRDLASTAGLSPWHFQRVFRGEVGLTPKQFGKAVRERRLSAGLKDASTVTGAVFDAGYGSASQGYVAAKQRLAMSPRQALRGAPGEVIKLALRQCDLGWACVAITAKGICGIEIGDNRDQVQEMVTSRFPHASFEEADRDLATLVEAAIEQVDHPAIARGLPLDIRGTVFQQKVWAELQKVPAGSTVSYKEMASRVGSPNASRAVAQACASNKIAVAVPCHRVVAADNRISGYRWGKERKRALLERERQGNGPINRKAILSS